MCHQPFFEALAHFAHVPDHALQTAGLSRQGMTVAHTAGLKAQQRHRRLHGSASQSLV